MKEARRLYEFSEKEIRIAVGQMPDFVAMWMQEVGIKYGSDINDGYDIYEPVNRALLDEWASAVKVQATLIK